MKFYLDTSVFGGCFDEEFREDTLNLFETMKEKNIGIVFSDVVLQELDFAPKKVIDFLQSLPEKSTEIIYLNDECILLAELYIKEGALTKKFINDAQHIAIVSVFKLDALISWNFKHMVNFFRIKQYNAINLKNGYPIIEIHSPKEIKL